MKFAPVFALCVASATAFTAPSMTFALGKKAAPLKKSAPAATKAVAKKVAPLKKAVVKAAAPVKKAVAPVKKAVVKAAPVKNIIAKAAPVKKAVEKKVVKPVQKAVAKAPVAAKKVVAPVRKAAAPVRKAAPVPVRKPIASRQATGTVPSSAIPGEFAPAALDGSLVGDVGFDPCYLSTKAPLLANYFNGIFQGEAPADGLTWYREAELMHGRICMVAVLGFIAPGFGTLGQISGIEAYSYKDPLVAFSQGPGAALVQIFLFMSFMEFRRIQFIREKGANYVAGASQNWGQGGYNPFNLNYTPEEYAEKQLQEIKHARLAMVGFLGVVFQANASGESVVQQLGAAFTSPDYYAKAGYFLPEGI
ncbi:hypothetical protein MPSEU_000524100 [Mayamaea pseudoterrestris]|nr:hypothetical protein MPSEU_000524100 [Mayamaea pseudoterrestris]